MNTAKESTKRLDPRLGVIGAATFLVISVVLAGRYAAELSITDEITLRDFAAALIMLMMASFSGVFALILVLLVPRAIKKEAEDEATQEQPQTASDI